MTKEDQITHVLLWSRSQSALHIEPLDQMLRSNRRAYISNQGTDYVPIHLGSDDECHKASEIARQTMSDRQRDRSAAGGQDFI